MALVPQTTGSRARFDARGALKLGNPEEDDLFKHPPRNLYYDRSSGIATRKIDGKPLPRIPPRKKPKDPAEEVKYLRGNAPALARLLVQLHSKEGASTAAIVKAAHDLAAKAAELLENPRVIALIEEEQRAKRQAAAVDSSVDSISQARADTLVGFAIKGEVAEVVRRIESGQAGNIDQFHSTLLFNALQGAASFGHLEVVQELIVRGANANARDVNHGNTALHYAAQNGRLEIIEFLKRAGARVPVHNLVDEKPADLAREYHKDLAARMLKEVPPPARDLTPSSVAARTASFEWTAPELNLDTPPLDRVEFQYRVISESELAAREQTEEAALARGESADLPPLPHPDEEPIEEDRYDAVEDGEGAGEGAAAGELDLDPLANHEEGRQPGSAPGWFAAACEPEPPYHLHSLTPSTCYCVTVRLHNSADYSDSSSHEPGWSRFCATTIIHTLDAPPSAPSPPTMFSTTSSSITVEWSPPKHENGSPVMQYDLQYAVSLADELHEADQGQVNLRKLDWVRVVGKIYVSRDKNAVMPPTEDGIAPKAALTATTAEPAAPAAGSGAARAAERKKQREPAEEMVVLPAGYCRHTVFNLQPYTYYFFRVRALNDDGWGEWSKVAEPILATDAVGFTELAPRSVLLHWQEPKDCRVLAYELQQRLVDAMNTADGGTWSTVSDRIPRNFGVYPVEELEPYTEYQWRVRALEPGTGWRPWASASVSRPIRTLACEPGQPGQPTSLAVYYNAIELQWQPSNNHGSFIDVYEVKAKGAQSEEWEVEQTVVADATGNVQVPNCRFSRLEPKTEYVFVVRAHNKLGWSAPSAISEPIQTRATLPPGPPQLLSQGASYIEIYWEPPDDRTGVVHKFYEMQAMEVATSFGARAPAAAQAIGSPPPAAKGGADAATGKWHTVPCKTREPRGLATDLRPAAGYMFRVRALTSAGWSNFSEPSEVFETLRRA